MLPAKGARHIPSLGDAYSIANTCHSIAVVHRAMGDLQAAEGAYRAALDYWRQTNNPYRSADALNDLGVLYNYRGDFAAARATRALDGAATITGGEAFVLSSSALCVPT
jgi:Flp pilus assembly protein TadD